MMTREIRQKELQAMLRTTAGRAEIRRLSQAIRGTSTRINMTGLFVGQMIADILASEYPASEATVAGERVLSLAGASRLPADSEDGGE